MATREITCAREKMLARNVDLMEEAMTSILPLMLDDRVMEVMVNPDKKVWIDVLGEGMKDTGIHLDPEDTKRIIFNVAAITGQVIEMNRDPRLQADIPKSRLFANCRFQAELPPIVSAPSFNIRKHSKKVYTLEDYVVQGAMTDAQYKAIRQAIADHRNIIAAGGTASGKTTLLNAILAEISKYPERIVTIEDTKELQCSAENKVALTTMAHVDMAELLRTTLRKSPNRIVVGEVRGGEALTLIDAWSTGHRGGCSTVHSDSAEETLYRLEGMVERVSKNKQEAAIGRAINVIVYIAQRAAVRRVEEVIAVEGWTAERGYKIHRLATG